MWIEYHDNKGFWQYINTNSLSKITTDEYNYGKECRITAVYKNERTDVLFSGDKDEINQICAKISAAMFKGQNLFTLIKEKF